MEQSVLSCWRFLQGKSIKVQKEWLEACIEWLVEENNNQLPNPSKLMELVYEQWLMADLKEIAVASLPQALASINGSKTIPGTYSVQVNKIMDIGHSAYSQLMKVKGQEIDDVVEDDDEENNLKEFFKKGANDKKPNSNQKWKEKSCRMLFMELHDGFQTIDAIEYRPIRHISIADIIPGTKVLLTGPLLFRDGMILLKPENVKLLGGNVEQLVESSSHLKLLCNVLKIEGDIGNDQQKQQRKPQQQQPLQQLPVTQTRAQPRQQQSQPSLRQNQKSSNTSQISKSSTNIISTNITNQSSTTNTKHKKKPTSENLIDDFDDDFFGNDMFDDVEIDDWSLSINDNKGSARKQSSTSKTNFTADSHYTCKSLSKPKTSLVPPYNEKKEFSIQKQSTQKKLSLQNKSLQNSKLKNDFPDLEWDDGLFTDIDTKKKASTDFFHQNNIKCNSTTITKKSPLSLGKNEQNCSLSKSVLEGIDPYMDATNIVSAKKVSTSVIPVPEEKTCLIPEPDLDDFFGDPYENDMQQIVPDISQNSNIKEIKLCEMIQESTPFRITFTMKGWFKTLRSKLEYLEEYKLLAVLTDGTYFAQVLLGNEVLNQLVGYTSSQVRQVVMGQVTLEQKNAVKKALHSAERALQQNKFIMHIRYDEKENIYKVIYMKSVGIV